MNQNYYNNPYYGGYGNQYQPIQQPVSYNTMQPNRSELVFINGIEEAKAYIVAPNKKVYLKDLTSNKLFEKRADAQGLYELKVYEVKEINQDAQSQFISKNELNDLESRFNSKIDRLSDLIQKSITGQNTNVKQEILEV